MGVMCCGILEPEAITVKKQTVLSMTRIVVTCLVLLALPEIAFADEKSLPYQTGLETLQDSFTGTVPFVISLAGIVGCGAMLIFGGEISGFMRTMVFIVLVVAVIVQASSLIGFLKGSAGGAGRIAQVEEHVTGPVV